MTVELRTLDPDPSLDQRVTLHDIPWWQYEALLAMRGDAPVPRMTYLNGELELMSPSIDHEEIKKTLARLVEMWAWATRTPLSAYGSWTVRNADVKRGAEADECYVVGRVPKRGPKPAHPDFAIEVIWTHGGIDKLEVWRKLGVREVWVWEDGEITARVLEGEAWAMLPRSRLLPAIDLAFFAELIRDETQIDAIDRLLERLRATPAS